MKSFKISLLLISAQLFSAGFIFAGNVPPDSTIFPGLKGQQLMDSIAAYYKATTNLGYDGARDTLYGVIDKDSTDSLQCIYSGHKISMIKTGAYIDSSNRAWAYYNGFDCEHTWPQSSFAQSGVPRADMHHLYACQRSPVSVNGDRGDSPFREIPDTATDYWYRRIEKTSTPPNPSIRDQYSEDDNAGNGSWEVREQWMGNVARGIFYFYNIYRNSHPAIETWWTGQLPYINDLLQWHITDPADAAEISRTKKIATYQQGKVNPFVLDSTLIRRAYFPSLGVTGKPQINIADRNRLYQNSPNPFRDKTVISYSLSSPGQARIEIYNLLGQAVRTIEVNKPVSGRYELEWTGADQAGRMLPPGIYFYRLSVKGKTVDLKRMIMLK